MIGISKERLNHQSRQVSASTVPKLPKLGKMIFARGPREPKATASSTHTLAGAMGSRTKVLTGKGVMEKARKEARQQSLLRSRRSVLATPTHKLAAHATRLSVGPPSLVYAYQHPEYQHSDAPEYRERAIKPAKTAVPESSRVRPSPSALKSTEEKERRLKAFTNPRPLAPASSGSDQKAHNNPPSSPPSTPSDSDSPKLRHAQDSSAMSPPTHKIPRIKSASSPEKEIRPRMRTRAPVDCFIPAKRRRLA